MAAKSEKQSEPLPPEAVLDGLPKKITVLLEKESDRAAILILGAYLEEILALIVRAACTFDQLGKELLEFRSPAGDFSSKITLCEAFGLISPDESKALNALRKIRNAAAHFDQKGRGFDVLFDSPQTVEQVKGFVKHINLELKSDKPDHVRELFLIAARLLSAKLIMRAVLTTRPVVAKSSKEIANFYRTKMKDSPVGKAISEAEKQAQEGNPEKLLELFQSIGDRLKEKAAARTAKEQSPPTEPTA